MVQILCTCIAWSVVAVVLLELGSLVRRIWVTAHHHHQMPCWGCQYYSGEHQLKCALHPTHALTPQSIGCRDFDPGGRRV